MVYRGHVEKGVVILDDPVTLPEGLSVTVEPSASGQQQAALDESGETLGQKLLKTCRKGHWVAVRFGREPRPLFVRNPQEMKSVFADTSDHLALWRRWTDLRLYEVSVFGTMIRPGVRRGLKMVGTRFHQNSRRLSTVPSIAESMESSSEIIPMAEISPFNRFMGPAWPDRFGQWIAEWSRRHLANPIRTLSLFTGAGGLDIGFHEAGFHAVEMVDFESGSSRRLRPTAACSAFSATCAPLHGRA